MGSRREDECVEGLEVLVHLVDPRLELADPGHVEGRDRALLQCPHRVDRGETRPRS